MLARPSSQRVQLTWSLLCLAALSLTIAIVAAAQRGALPQIGGGSAGDGRLAAGYGELPLAFEQNRGQTDGRVDFLARTSGQTAFLTSTGATLTLQPSDGSTRGAAVRIDLIGADPAARPGGLHRLPGEVNVLRGDSKGSTTGIPTFERVRYADVYPGVDVAWYGTQGGQLEYDFIVSPGADPGVIGMEFDGAGRVSLTDSGALRLQTASGTLVQRPPVAYQEIDGVRTEVPSRYRLTGHRVGVQVGAYDPERPLVIDPTLVYSTFLGEVSGGGVGEPIAVDGDGSTYVTGNAFTPGFPTTPGAFDTSFSGSDAFVAKLNPAGSALEYSTYINAAHGRGITVDAGGSAYVTGETSSPAFPATPGAFDTTHNNGQDVFVAKLNPAGSGLDYATYLGGNSADLGYAVAVDATGSAYITGLAFSPAYPTTPGAFDETKNGPGPGGPSGDARDAIVTKLNPTGSGLEYSTFLGGTLGDDGFGIAVDGTGSAYVGGLSASTAFPTTPGAFDTTYGGSTDGYVTKLNPGGSALDYSTYLGGTAGDQVNALEIDASGNAYVAGGTGSAAFPATPGAFDTTHNGGQDAFVAQLDAAGSSLSYATFLGGTGTNERAMGVAVDGAGNAWVSGDTDSTDFPTSPDAFDADYNGGVRDAFVAQFDGAGASLEYSTFLGGSVTELGGPIVVDGDGNAYARASTNSTADFPTTPGAFDESYNSTSPFSHNAFVAKFGTAPPNPDTDGDGIFDSVDPDPGTPSTGFEDGDGNSGSITDPNGLSVSITDATAPDGVRVVVGPGAGKATLSVCGGFTLKLSAGSDVIVTCGSVTVEVLAGDAEIVLGDGTTTVLVPPGVTATVTENPDGSYEVTNHGGGDVTVTVDGVETTVGPGESTEVRTWHFVGFTSPVDNIPVMNVANAGQAIPLKWRLLDASGAPVTDLTTAHMTATSLACSLGSTPDLLEESAPGGSGLQNLGDGYYQLNWKTPKSYAKSCKTLHLDLGEGITRDAYFQFRK
jgi:hypothetical protein